MQLFTKSFVRTLLGFAAGVTLLNVGLYALSAFAQAADAAPDTASADALASVATWVLTGIETKNWGLLVAAVLVALVALVRWLGGMLPKLAPVVAHPVVAVLLPTVLSISGAIGTALAAGRRLDVALVIRAITEGVLANGVFNIAKKLVEARAVSKGTDAAAAVDTKAQALAQLPKP